MVDEFADSFYARRGAVSCNDSAIWFLGHADFLEFKNDSRTVSIYFKIKSRVLRRRRLSAKFYLSRVVLGAFAFDSVLLGVDGGNYVYRRVVF